MATQPSEEQDAAAEPQARRRNWDSSRILSQGCG